MDVDNGIPSVPVTLKWNKRVFENQLSIQPGSSADQFKDRIQILTGVPKTRQKLMCKKGGWKGVLKDDVVFGENLVGKTLPLIVTLIGSADAIPEPPQLKTKFVEDLTAEEIAAATAKEEQAAWKDAEGMIVPLQMIPIKRNDNKTELYQYNHFVTGLPQRQIEDTLRRRSQQEGGHLVGEIVMTMGLELRRAYVNALTVLPIDGTLVSALDDGHIQMWRHGALVHDVIHDGRDPGGVDCVESMNHPELAFATGGRGCIRIWTNDGNCVHIFASLPGTSPSSLVAFSLEADSAPDGGMIRKNLCLASSFRITRQTNPNQFRLVPQDEMGRRRRAEAEAQEASIQEMLNRASRSVQILFSGASNGLQALSLEPNDIAAAAPIISLAAIGSSNYGDTQSKRLVCGDSAGGLRVWQVGVGGTTTQMLQCEQQNLFQLNPKSSEAGEVASLVCMEVLPNKLLAVSTERKIYEGKTHLPGASLIDVPSSQAVFIIDVERWAINVVLDGHKDRVGCMASLPDGGLATGGGKMDATLRVWGEKEIQKIESSDENMNVETKLKSADASTELKEIGYVLALAALPDSKTGSQHFALSVARYNVIKIYL